MQFELSIQWIKHHLRTLMICYNIEYYFLYAFTLVVAMLLSIMFRRFSICTGNIKVFFTSLTLSPLTESSAVLPCLYPQVLMTMFCFHLRTLSFVSRLDTLNLLPRGNNSLTWHKCQDNECIFLKLDYILFVRQNNKL